MQLEIEGIHISHPCKVAEEFAKCLKTVFNNFTYATFLFIIGTHNPCPYILSLILTFIKPFNVSEFQNFFDLNFLALPYRLVRIVLELNDINTNYMQQ